MIMFYEWWQRFWRFGKIVVASLRDNFRAVAQRHLLVAMSLAVVMLMVTVTTLVVTRRRASPLAGPTAPTATPRLTYAPPDAPLATQSHHIGPDFATYYNQQRGALWWWQAGGDPRQDGIFVAAPTATDPTLGYYIPTTFVPFLSQLRDWQALIGLPITQTYAATAQRQDGVHKLVIQAFAHAVLWLDQTTPGAPQVAWQQAGADYLLTFGAPVATFVTPFTLTCLGDTAWQNGVLWYHVAWQNLAQQRDGWLSEDQLQLVAPAQVGRQIGDLAALSPQLSAYVQSQGADVGIAVYIPATNRLFLANASQLMEMDSTFKIPILVTLLHETEQQGRALTTVEDQEATVMIEQSDNTAFEELYEDVGGQAAIESYMRAIGIPSVHVNTTGIGSTLIAPQAMITLLDDLQEGHILAAANARYVLNLMQHIVPGQRMGIGDTAPPGASFAMKDGYSSGIDFGFNMNSAGIVTDKGSTYIIAVYSRHHLSQDIGTQVVDTICRDVVKALLAS